MKGSFDGQGIMKSTKESCSALCGPPLKRYIILLLWCTVILIIYFEYDMPGSLQNHIIDDYHIGPYQFAYLYSAYSWPNIVMCFVGGYLIDRVLGVKVGLNVFVAIACLGQALVIVGAFQGIFILMLAGRFIYGMGCESAGVAINNDAVLWFSGRELNVVFAILTNTGRIGSAVVFQSSQPTYEWMSKLTSATKVLPCTILFLGCFMAIAVISSIIVLFMKPENSDGIDNNSSNDKIAKQEPAKVTTILDFMTFPLQYWLLVSISSVYIGVLYSFLGQSQASFTSKFGVDDATANNYVFFFSFFGAALSPCLGFMVDKKGRNLSFIVLAYVTGIIGFILVAYTYVNPYLSMFFLSFSMAAFFSSIWALYSYIIPEHQLATAYGIVQAGMNLALSVGTISAGAIAGKFGFEWMETFVLGGLVVTAPLVVWTWLIDVRGTGILNMTTVNRNSYMENQKEAEHKPQIELNSPHDSKDDDTLTINPA